VFLFDFLGVPEFFRSFLVDWVRLVRKFSRLLEFGVTRVGCVSEFLGREVCIGNISGFSFNSNFGIVQQFFGSKFVDFLGFVLGIRRFAIVRTCVLVLVLVLVLIFRVGFFIFLN
jgi:hypothetical protein